MSELGTDDNSSSNVGGSVDSNVVCFYHNDYDGHVAATAVYKLYGDRCTYCPVDWHDLRIDGAKVYGTNSLNVDIAPASEVFILDFAFPSDVIYRWHEAFNFKLIMYDHHKSRASLMHRLQAICPSYVIATGNEPACLWAWRNIARENTIPSLVKVVADVDMGRYDYRDALNVHYYLTSLRYHDIPCWYSAVTSVTLREASRAGEVIRGAFEEVVRRLLSQGMIEVYLHSGHSGHNGNRGNSDNDIKIGVLVNPFRELNNTAWLQAQRMGYNILILISYLPGCTVTTLRSNNGIDVSKIAMSLGGGGHRCAAGFVLDGYRSVGEVWAKIKGVMQNKKVE